MQPLSPPSTRPDWSFLCGFIAISLLGGIGFGLARMITTLYALQLGLSASTLGCLSAAQSLGILLLALPMGLWVERYGPYRLFMLGSLSAGLLYSLIPWWPAPGWLLLCTALISFCLPCRFVALNTLFMVQFGRLGEARSGWMRANSLLGMLLLGPAIATWVIHRCGFAGAFVFTALVVWLAMLLAPRILKPAPQATTTPRRAPMMPLSQQLHSVITDPLLRQTSVVEFFLQASISFFSFFIVPLAIQQFHFTPTQATHLITAEGSLFIGALFLLGHLIPRYGLPRVYLLSLGSSALALILLGMATHPIALWLGTLLLGVALGLLQTATLTSFARIGLQIGQGRIAGIMTLVGPAGGLFGGLGGGSLASVCSLQSTFLALALALSLLAWQHGLQMRRHAASTLDAI